MKNKDLIKKIIPIADRLDEIDLREQAYRGYELACILSNDYNGRVSNINALLYSRWLWEITDCLPLEVIQKYG